MDALPKVVVYRDTGQGMGEYTFGYLDAANQRVYTVKRETTFDEIVLSPTKMRSVVTMKPRWNEPSRHYPHALQWLPYVENKAYTVYDRVRGE